MDSLSKPSDELKNWRLSAYIRDRHAKEFINQHELSPPKRFPSPQDLPSSRSIAGYPSLYRPRADGKFFYVGEEKFLVRGVTYGTFATDAKGRELHHPEVVKLDFALMVENGINAIRTYTVPPTWFLDTALHYGLRVMVGLPWEQHVAFLAEKERAHDIEKRVCAAVRSCSGHPAILAYAIGNEIPTAIVRWHGPRPTERFLERLYRSAKAEDPGALFTYVNYPSTEYLELPFLDFLCFNVYLEAQVSLEAYLARLQNMAGDRPLVMGEIGLDSRRHGELAQARNLGWQVRTTFAAGCAGAFVFAWTDEWHRGGVAIEDWDFGLTGRDRRPKRSMAAVREAFAEVPFTKDWKWPFISVIVCTYNGSRTIRTCLEKVLKLEYPNFEVIVVNDGSTDSTPAILQEYGVRIISTENHGLSSARNTGLAAAGGEIVAYTDDDAYPDRHWLTYLAHTFLTTSYVGVGGPNVPPKDDGLIADCVANAPGGPIHVLLSDREAEHIPGCNMAFRKAALQAIDGFDPQFRSAGDDVDICWRLIEQGWKIGFNPAAMVWHHRRNSIRGYLKQQRGYGRAEAMLEKKWPENYNRLGHLRWHGRIYGKVLNIVFARRGRIYQGTWGAAPFQGLYQPASGLLRSLPLMPEWFLLTVGLGLLSVFGLLWTPLLIASPLFVLTTGLPVLQAIQGARHTPFTKLTHSDMSLVKLFGGTALLHFLQPLARLWGRLAYGLTPWRWRGHASVIFPLPRSLAIWSERWQSSSIRLECLEGMLRRHGVLVVRGGAFDRWDLEARTGTFGGIRLLTAIEEHGMGKQVWRVRIWPHSPPEVVGFSLILLCLGLAAAINNAWIPATILSGMGLSFFVGMLGQCASAMAIVLGSLNTDRLRTGEIAADRQL
jgi:O-antigen biosynthesis protein